MPLISQWSTHVDIFPSFTRKGRTHFLGTLRSSPDRTDRWLPDIYLGLRIWGSIDYEKQEEISEVIELFYDFNVVVGTQLYIFAKTHTEKGYMLYVDYSFILKMGGKILHRLIVFIVFSDTNF